MDGNQSQPPETVKDVGIHLYYMGKDLNDIKMTLKDTPSRKEFDEVKLQLSRNELAIEQMQLERAAILKSLDEIYVTKKEFRLALAVVTTIISVGVGLLAIWDKIKP